MPARQLAAANPFGTGAQRKAQEGGVESPLPHPFDQLLTRARAQTDAYFPVTQMEPLERGGQVHRRHRGNGPDGEPSPDLPGGRRHFRPGPLGCVQRLTGGGKECLAGGGQTDPAAGPLEEPGTQFPFQPGDLVTQRGLDDQTLLGGPREVLRLRDCDDVAHLL